MLLRSFLAQFFFTLIRTLTSTNNFLILSFEKHEPGPFHSLRGIKFPALACTTTRAPASCSSVTTLALEWRWHGCAAAQIYLVATLNGSLIKARSIPQMTRTRSRRPTRTVKTGAGMSSAADALARISPPKASTAGPTCSAVGACLRYASALGLTVKIKLCINTMGDYEWFASMPYVTVYDTGLF